MQLNTTQPNPRNSTQYMHLSIVCILQHDSPPKSVFRFPFSLVLEAMAGWDNFTHLIKILLNYKPLPNRLKRNICAGHIVFTLSPLEINQLDANHLLHSCVSVICKLSRRRKINRLKIQFYQIYLPRWKQLEWT